VWVIFATLTTIGYGDEVPFWHDEGIELPRKFIDLWLIPFFTFVFIVIGLSLVLSLFQSASDIFSMKSEKVLKGLSFGGSFGSERSVGFEAEEDDDDMLDEADERGTEQPL
jgi:hypothetical protein